MASGCWLVYLSTGLHQPPQDPRIAREGRHMQRCSVDVRVPAVHVGA